MTETLVSFDTWWNLSCPRSRECCSILPIDFYPLKTLVSCH